MLALRDARRHRARPARHRRRDRLAALAARRGYVGLWLVAGVFLAVAELWPALLLVALRLTLAPRFPSTHALIGDWYNHALYASMFLLGVLLARQEAAWEALRAWRWTALAAAAAAYALIAWASVTHAGPSHLLRVAYGIDQWTAVAAVLGFARQRAPGDGPVRRYLTQAVFPFYIVHQTAIVMAAHHLKPLALAPGVEGPLLVAVTFATCFASFEIVRRVRVLRPLFGLGPQVTQPRASIGQIASTTPRSSPPFTTT